MKIESRFWAWDRVDWSEGELMIPEYSEDLKGRFVSILVPTKELFEIFGSESVKPKASPAGAKRKYDWDAFYVEIAVRADLDNLPETSAELQRDMAEWCLDTWGKEPGESSIKKYVAPIYQHPRKR